MDLAGLVGPGPARRLNAVGITTVEDLAAMNPRELEATPGIGPAAVSKIMDVLHGLRLQLAVDPWARYVCARDGRPAADADLAGFFLCADCLAAFRDQAFGGTDPEWVACEVVMGFCSHCNSERHDIRLTQWHLCGVCTRVLRSIGRGLVAARFVNQQWAEHVANLLPNVHLEETDPPHLQPRSKEQRALKVSTADFTATDARSGIAIFGFELKSGRSAAAGGGVGVAMSQFQLDTTDCDDILTVVRRERIPVYLLHAQVLGRAEPPTERFAGVNLWWTDMWTMDTAFQAVRMRGLETRMAAYFKTSMFRQFPRFAAYVADGVVDRDQARLESEGAPALYRADRA